MRYIPVAIFIIGLAFMIWQGFASKRRYTFSRVKSGPITLTLPEITHGQIQIVFPDGKPSRVEIVLPETN